MSAPNQYTAPNATEYGGDEVSAIVLDPGFSGTRAGWAGEDCPKSVVPTYYGIYSPPNEEESETLFGDNALHNPIPHLEIKNPLAGEGAEDWVSDWDTAAKLWEYTITTRLISPKPSSPAKNGLNENGAENGDKVDVDMEDVDQQEKPLNDNPLLMSEPGKSSPKSREKCIEFAMENWGTPAFWMGSTGVLSAFSAGKPSALVIDIGASMISVTPVIDGMKLKKGVRTSPLGGNYISSQIRSVFAQSTPPVPLTPHYMVASKIPVDAGQPSQATYKHFATPPTESFRAWEEERVLTEFKESVVQVWEGPGRLNSGSQGTTNVDVVKNWPGRPFEMPDGWNQVFSADRFRPAEPLFDENAAIVDDISTLKPKPEHTIPRLINSALMAVDADSRPQLLNHIVVVGASSLLQGLTKRIDTEISAMFPGPRVRLHAPSSTVERKYAAWIGGSILASLGTFHQNWISKKEYDEHGAGIIEKRCK